MRDLGGERSAASDEDILSEGAGRGDDGNEEGVTAAPTRNEACTLHSARRNTRRRQGRRRVRYQTFTSGDEGGNTHPGKQERAAL